MADQHNCDMCGALIIGSPLRYELHMKLFAGYDVIELTAEELDEDHSSEMEDLVRQMEGSGPQELQAEVFEEFRFDLCPECRAEFRKDPLKGHRRQR